MNRLKVRDALNNIFLGKMPHSLEDFDWQDVSVRDAFKGLLYAFGPTISESFVLTGCVVDELGAGSNTAGYIALNGEVLPVDAQASLPVPGAGQFRYWDVVQTFDPAGSKLFQNSVTHDCYEVRKGKIVVGSPAAGTYMPLYAPKLLDVIANYTFSFGAFALRAQGNWHIVGDAGEPAFENVWQNYDVPSFGPLRFLKDQFGFVCISGAVSQGTVGSTTPIFHLPAGFRPVYQEAFIIPADNTTTGSDALQRIIVYPDGRVSITASIAAAYIGTNHFCGIPNLRFRAG